MSDLEPRASKFQQTMSVVENLKRGRQVSQNDIKAAVVETNQLRKENTFFRGHVPLALALCNLNSRKGDKGILLEPDQELADALTLLKQDALVSLEVQRQMVPTITCTHQPRNPDDIQRDIDFAEYNLLIASTFLGNLINQVTPKQE